MEASRKSDQVLVERLLPSTNHDPRDRAVAWEEWYVQVGAASVLSFVRAKNDSSEPDMDIVQEAMMMAYLEVERGRYEPRVGIPLTAYVKGIANNKIREARRRARRLMPLDDAPEHAIESEEPQLDSIVERREQRAALRRCLSELSSCRRQVLEGYLQGRSTAEIAQRLGITQELVRQHKSRGLRTLRASLRQVRPARLASGV